MLTLYACDFPTNVVEDVVKTEKKMELLSLPFFHAFLQFKGVWSDTTDQHRLTFFIYIATYASDQTPLNCKIHVEIVVAQ